MNRLAGPLPVLLLALAACSSSTDVGDDGFSQGEAEAFAEQVGTAFANGMAGAAPVAAFPASPAGLSPAAVPVNVQLRQRTNCTAGGHIEVSGNMTGSIDQNGSGALFLQVLETITDWRCVGGRVINGDPYLSAAGTFTFLNGAQSGTASLSFGGAFKWTGAGAGSCSLTLTALFHPDHTGRLSGVVCGRSVNVCG